ncbi:MAG: carboxypeptidase regulatory-like domain-containing protein, partial [Proteobacteria bacterium]|nr:carboxypeptidase regulatory-like domain-containing protein [Pseudomonadota bacterium]
MIRLGTLLLLGSLLLLPGITAQAQMNMSDFFLSVKVSGEDEAYLKWNPPEGVAVEYYLVFRASLTTTTMPPVELSSFTQIDSTNDTMMSDKPPLDEAQVFAYVVLAKTAGGIELRSNVSVANFLGYTGDHDIVRITSEPPIRAEIGVEYTYQVVAVSSDPSATLTYMLHRGPDGMVMSAAGLVTWTPTNSQVGWHRIGIRVESNLGGKREQEYYISVGGGNGVVQGHVRDTSGAPISRVMVKLYQRDRDRHFEYRAITDGNGFYRISPVDPATYLLRAVPLRPDFIGQWYNGVRHVWEATPVSVPDTSVGVTIVNFVLRSAITTRPHFTVTGTVTDDQGAALENAWVLFVRPEFCFNASGHDNNGFEDGGYDRDAFDWKNFPNQWRFDHRLDGLSKWVFRVQTDVNGNYSIRLPQGKYIALALKRGYSPIFFDGKTDLLSADIIELRQDLSGINFALPILPPVPLGEISGIVTDVMSSDPVPSRMIAFR